MARRFPPGDVVVYTSAEPGPGTEAFDAVQPFPVVRDRARLLLPTPRTTATARALAFRYGCDRVWFGAAAPLGLMAARLGLPSVATTHGHEMGWAMLPGARQALARIARTTGTVTYLTGHSHARMSAVFGPHTRTARLVPGVDADTFDADRSGVARSDRARSGADRSDADRSGADRSHATRSAADRSHTDTFDAVRSGVARSDATRSGADRSHTARSVADRPGAANPVRRELGLGERPLVLCVSRLVPRKGQDTLVRALPLVRRTVPDATLLIVGSGPYGRTLRRLARAQRARHGLPEGAIVFAGPREHAELPPYYAAADVFAMPCRTRRLGLEAEGLGIVYLEAAAAGLPVLAGDSGGAPDAVRDGETGYVVDGRDVGAVADRLTALLADPAAAAVLGAKGRAWVREEWSWDASARRLRELLSRTVEEC